MLPKPTVLTQYFIGIPKSDSVDTAFEELDLQADSSYGLEFALKAGAEDLTVRNPNDIGLRVINRNSQVGLLPAKHAQVFSLKDNFEIKLSDNSPNKAFLKNKGGKLSLVEFTQTGPGTLKNFTETIFIQQDSSTIELNKPNWRRRALDAFHRAQGKV